MEEDLVMLAKEKMLQGFKKNEGMLTKISTLDVPLNSFYWTRRPNAQDYDDRRDLVRIFNAIAREIYGDSSKNCPVVEEFGSFLMDMFDAKSDLDLSINIARKSGGSHYMAKVRHLRRFAAKLYALQDRGLVRNVQPILTARVPVLKVTDCGTGIECDLSFKNVDGIAKSRFVLMISAIDDRFQKLSFLMKAWARTHNINSSKDGTLNSISLILLAAFHLQTRDPPILPPFSETLKDGIQSGDIKENISSFSNYGKENKQSLAELFVSLLIVLESVETLWAKGLCASTYHASWLCKPLKAKKGYIHIEDFTDKNEDTARAVKSDEMMNKIYSCIRQSLQRIQSYISGEMTVVKLKNWLFGPDVLKEEKGVTNINSQFLRNPVLKEPTERKRKRQTKGDSKQGQGGFEKPDNNSILHPAESSRKKLAGVGKSQETSSMTHAQPSHPNLFSQIPTGFRPERHLHSWSSVEGQRGEKPDESSCHPAASFHTRSAGLVRSWGTPGYSHAHPSHPNVFSQVPTGFRSERPLHTWGPMEAQRGLGKLDESSRHAHSQPNPFSQVPTGFRPERPVDSWRYGESNFPNVAYPRLQPYAPSNQYALSVGFERSHGFLQPFPFPSSPFPGGFHAPDNRKNSAPVVYTRPVNAPHVEPNRHQDPRGTNLSTSYLS